jgi:hypothetical protein
VEVAGQRELLSRLRAVAEAKDAENAVLRAERGLRRRLELRLAELERRLPVDSSDSGTPSSKEARRARQQAERDPDPDENKDAEPPAQCRLREAHQAVGDARARGSTALGADLLDELHQRYDEAAAFGITHNRLRDWHEGNHPATRWLRDYKEQVFLFTRDFAADWTTNVAQRGAKAAKRHQAVSGYWHSLATLARCCRIRSYLDSAAAHGITALDAIRDALTGKPWLPPLPAAR